MYRGRDSFCDCLISIIELTQNQYKTILPLNEILSTYIEINLDQHMRAQKTCIGAETRFVIASFQL
jgi:hypothetical protein